MSLLPKRKRSTTAPKYFMDCGDPSKTLQTKHIMEINSQRILIEAIQHGAQQGAQQSAQRVPRRIVVKIYEQELVDRAKEECKASEMLQSIPGFLRFVCLTQCQDNYYRYEANTPTPICAPGDLDRVPLNLLVMPFLPLGPMKRVDWRGRLDALKSCLKQVVASTVLAFERHGFLHRDLHLDNVLVKHTTKRESAYEGIANFPLHGLCVRIMDFELSITETPQSSEQLWYDLQLLFNDLGNHPQGAGLKLNGHSELKFYIAKQVRKQEKKPEKESAFRVCAALFPMIDVMTWA